MFNHDEFLHRMDEILYALDGLAAKHTEFSDPKNENYDDWFVFGRSMAAMHSHLQAIRALADHDGTHPQVAILSRSIMEIMGMFTWTTGSKERARVYTEKTKFLIENPHEMFRAVMDGEADKLSVFAKDQPRNDTAYRELISQSGLDAKNAKTLDQNYDELSLFVHPSPAVAASFGNNDESAVWHYTKPALFSLHMVIARAKDMQLIAVTDADVLRSHFSSLVKEIATTEKSEELKLER